MKASVTTSLLLLGKIFGDKCPCCKGSGKSPSTMDGKWTKESAKKELDAYIKANIEKLSEHEAMMGLGGNEIVDITKHKIETIGLVMNDFGSIRVDNVGKIHNSSIVVHKICTPTATIYTRNYN